MDPDTKEYSAWEMADLYRKHPHQWLLLEVLTTNAAGRAQRLKLWKYATDKNELYDFLMDELEDWDWSKNFIFVYSDPEKECELF